MARWAVFLVSVGLLGATVDGLSPYPEDYDLIEGASPGSERLRQGTALNDYMLNRPMCDATCNNQPLETDECQGTVKIKCSGQNETHGHNITTFSVLQCKGHWSSSGWNESERTSISTYGEIVCNGAFHEKTLVNMVHSGSSIFSVAEFGCAFMYSYEMTAMGKSFVDSSTCHGAAATKMLRSSEGNKTAVTREFMEALLDDVAGDDIDFTLVPDSDQQPYVDFLSDAPNVTVTCDGEPAVPHESCYGTFDIDIQVGNISIADECRGWWVPAPGEKHIAGCMGDWTTEVSGEHGELDGSCVGHAVLAVMEVNTPNHHFHGRRALCVGKHDMTSEFAWGHVRQGFNPTVQKTTRPVIVS